MSQNQVSRRHHYLPQFYLKRWTSGKGTLIQFSKPRDDQVKALRVYPKQTGFVDRLYELRGSPPDEAHHYEAEFFRPIDTRAAMVLAKFEAGDFKLDDRERSAWSDFVMSLVMRHPEHIEAVRTHVAEDVASDPTIRERGRFRLPNSRPANAKRIETELGSDDGIARVALTTVTRTIGSRLVGEALINMQWGLVNAPLAAPAVLTSDRPILWEHTLNDDRFRLMLPIGPKRIFYAALAGSFAAAQMNGLNAGTLVEMLNDHVTRRAIRFVYGLGDGALSYVQERMGVDPISTLVDRIPELRRGLDRRVKRRRREPTSTQR